MVHVSLTQPDPELNSSFYFQTIRYSEYMEEYKEYFEDLNFGIHFSMSLYWFVSAYEDVYTHKSKVYYNGALDNFPDKGETNARGLAILYNSDPEKYYYLKPFVDCYLLMDKNHKVTDEGLKKIKETILYAIDYYANGVDYKEKVS